MENDLISRSALLRGVPSSRKATGKTAWDCGVLYMENVIKNAPAVDPESLRPTGRWAHLGGDEWSCTNCGFVISTEGSWEKPTKKFCEDCGAKMEG